MRRSFGLLDTDAGWDDQPTLAEFGHEETVAAAPDARFIQLEPGTAVGEYVIEQLIGKGGMAHVFSAIHPEIGRRVAIKVLCDAEPTATARFVQEARAVNRIGHDNIVDIFSMGTLPDGRRYLVMEWLDGRDLAHEIARGPMSIADAVDVLDQIADALQAVHAHDIAHRDLKPDNVFVVEANGRRDVKLLDFGIAKLLGDAVDAPRHTQAGMMVGTPGYVSPEQARGLAVDHRTDIYALGMVAFQMVTGDLPFDGETGMDIVLRQIQEDPPPPSSIRRDLPRTLDSLIRRMMDREPAVRPSLVEVRATLGQIRAARFTTKTGSHPIADIPSLVTSPARAPTPMPRFRVVGTPPPVASTLPEVVVTFRAPSSSDVTKTSLVALPELGRWKTRALLACGAVAFTAAVAAITAYLA